MCYSDNRDFNPSFSTNGCSKFVFESLQEFNFLEDKQNFNKLLMGEDDGRREVNISIITLVRILVNIYQGSNDFAENTRQIDTLTLLLTINLRFP